MTHRTPEQVIVAAIRFDHLPTQNARRILEALEAAGYTVRRPALPETERVFAASPSVELVRAEVRELPVRRCKCLHEAAHKAGRL